MPVDRHPVPMPLQAFPTVLAKPRLASGCGPWLPCTREPGASRRLDQHGFGSSTPVTPQRRKLTLNRTACRLAAQREGVVGLSASASSDPSAS